MPIIVDGIDSSSDSESSDDGPPPLLGRGDPGVDSSSGSDDDDDDDSIPELVGRQGYGGDASSSSSDDDDDEIPPLVNNRGRGAANHNNRNNNRGRGAANNNRNNNRGVRRAANTNSNNNNNNRGNSNRGGGNNNRSNRNDNRNNSNNNNRDDDGSSSSTNESLPALIPRAAAGDDSNSDDTTDDDSDDDSGVPPLAPRRNRGDNSDSSDDDDESIPELIGRHDSAYDSSEDDDDDSEEAEAERQREQQQQRQRQRTNNDRSSGSNRRNQNNSNRNNRSSSNNNNNSSSNGIRLDRNMIRVDYWAQWIEEAQAMGVSDLKTAVQQLLGNSRANRHRWQGLARPELELEYATAQSRKLGGSPSPGRGTLRLPPPQRADWERLRQQLDDDPAAAVINYKREVTRTYGVALHRDPPRTDAEWKDLYICLRLQAEQQQKRERNLSAFETQVLEVQRERSAFRLRQTLRDDHHWDRTDFLDTHTDLARAVVYARQQWQPLCAAFADDVDHNIDAVPAAIPAKDPANSGAWVLAPLFGGGGGGGESNNNNHKKASNNNQTYELTYAWTDGTAIHKSKVYTTLNSASDVMLPAGAGSVWVYYKTKQGGAIDANNNNNNNLCYAVDQWRCQVADLRIPMYQNLPKATQLVTNGANGLWMLVPEPATTSTNNSRRSNRSKNNSSGSSKLVLYNSDHRDGSVVEQLVPSRKGVRLFRDAASGGVWVYVPQSKERQKQQQANNKALITAGLWHISITGKAVRVSFSSSVGDNDNDHQEDTQVLSLDLSLLASDSARAGVLVLGPTRSDKGKSSMLYHVTWNATEQAMATRHQRVDAKFENVQSILDDGAGGALLHYRKFKDMGWKLTRAVFGEFELMEQHKCPKNAKIVSTGQGAVWVLKKTGRGLNWGLQYLHETNSVEESTEKYAVNSILCGAYERENNS